MQTVVNGTRCGKCVRVGGPCPCSLWHVPPRYLPRGVPSPYAGGDTFCVARDPVERILSQWRMDGSRRNAQLGACRVMVARLAHRCGAAVSDCHVWPQHEYVWDGDGLRTCAHVLTFDDLRDQFGRLMRAAGRNVALPPVTSPRSALHHGASSDAGLNATVALMIRCVYKLDECLLFGHDIFAACSKQDLSLDGWTRACARPRPRVAPSKRLVRTASSVLHRHLHTRLTEPPRRVRAQR